MGRQFWKPGNMLYPLPCAMVSCARPGEKPNIITIAWTGTVCTDPAMVYISVRPSRYSYEIIKETGEFVINLTTENLVRAADLCGVKSGRDVDKFKLCGLHPVASKTIAAPAIEESPVAIECRVEKILPLGTHDMFLAKVLAVSADERYMDRKGKFHLNQTGLAAYSHGEYFSLGKEKGRFGYSVRKKKQSRSPSTVRSR